MHAELQCRQSYIGISEVEDEGKKLKGGERRGEHDREDRDYNKAQINSLLADI